MKKIELFAEPKNCRACGACASACPKDAISFFPDEFGFAYPKIDEAKCVGCGKCVATCSGLCRSETAPAAPPSEPKVYAAAATSDEIKRASASGGIFAEAARWVLARNGVAFGAAWNDDFSVAHVAVESPDDLPRLQGSKYVQSSIGSAFVQAKEALDRGRIVLFSGTPCQIAGLRAYLRKDYDNLYAVDIICHGVSNDALLREDVRRLLKKRGLPESGARATFRAKERGWGTSGRVSSGGEAIPFDSIRSPYYYYYLQGAIYRDSCYRCPYASTARVGDLTLGDFWGVEKALPRIEKEIDVRKGVSCVLVNAPKGAALFEAISAKIRAIPSTLEAAKRRNAQLSRPCAEPANRARLLAIYKEFGYEGLARRWEKNEKKARLKLRLKRAIPSGLKTLLKKLR